MALRNVMFRNRVSLDDVDLEEDQVPGMIQVLGAKRVIDAKLANSDYAAFTAPADGCVLTYFLKPESAVNVTVAPTASLSIVSAAGDIFQDEDTGIVGTDAANRVFQAPCSGTYKFFTAGATILFRIGTPATATSLLVVPRIIGFIFPS